MQFSARAITFNDQISFHLSADTVLHYANNIWKVTIVTFILFVSSIQYILSAERWNDIWFIEIIAAGAKLNKSFKPVFIYWRSRNW